MDRRLLLKLMAAASLLGCTPKANGLKVVVVGAGIIGASIAYYLAKAGARVTVIDKVGPASHASRGTFAWINATWAKQPRHYHTLSQDGVASWATLQAELDIPIKWTGSLEWFENPERHQKLAVQIEEQAEWGERASMVGGEDLAKLEPNVDFTNVSTAAYSANDGAVDPILATERLLDAAKSLGATVKYPCELLNVSVSASRVTSAQTSAGAIACDHLVLATGAAPDMPLKFAGIDIPQRTTPGVIAITKPHEPLLGRIIVGPGAHIHQRGDGRIVLGEQDGAPKTDAHAMRLNGRPNDFPTPEFAIQHGERILAVAETFIPNIGKAEIEATYIGWRPLPLDGHPVLGVSPARPNVSLAIMHSGVSLAPVVGQLMAQEIISGARIEQLNAYRPDRDFLTANTY